MLTNEETQDLLNSAKMNLDLSEVESLYSLANSMLVIAELLYELKVLIMHNGLPVEIAR